MSAVPPLGAIFDFDGVIVDSHDPHHRSWQLLAEELGSPLPEGFFEKTFGMRNDHILPNYTPWVKAGDKERIAELGYRKEFLYREIIRKEGIEPLPGVRRLLEELKEAGIPCAIGSSTPRENLEVILDITGLRPFFKDTAAAEDVERGKPAPDVFLCAARKIGREPANCFVIEDAHVGIQAALAAGAKAVAVATTNPLESFTAPHLAVRSLEELTLEKLRGLWS